MHADSQVNFPTVGIETETHVTLFSEFESPVFFSEMQKHVQYVCSIFCARKVFPNFRKQKRK